MEWQHGVRAAECLQLRAVRTAMGMPAADNLDAFFRGNTPPKRVA
jgi:hypothetical protein